jgi:ribonuclease HII
MIQESIVVEMTSRIGVICGVDEAGRGPLFGDVVAAAVILDPGKPIAGLGDSKKISEKVREKLYQQIYKHAISVGVGRASAAEIDQMNILQASMLAMKRAVESLSLVPDLALIDGNRCPSLICASEAIIKGDAKEITIGAASIIAKVTRDRMMAALDVKYPGYNLSQHQGYPVASHVAAIHRMKGISPIHRVTFKPIKGSNWKVLKQFQ